MMTIVKKVIILSKFSVHNIGKTYLTPCNIQMWTPKPLEIRHTPYKKCFCFVSFEHAVATFLCGSWYAD